MATHFALDTPTARPDTTRWVNIMRAEFGEMPCLSLTLPQAMRLWSLDADVCQAHLDALLREGFLRQTNDGMYRRAV